LQVPFRSFGKCNGPSDFYALLHYLRTSVFRRVGILWIGAWYAPYVYYLHDATFRNGLKQNAKPDPVVSR
jgi:hypothetical protein